MKRTIALFIFAATLLLGVAQTSAEKISLRNEIENDLTGNILPFWLNHASDPNGGFYGEISREGKGNPATPKGAIMGARVLWTFSTAYRLYGNSDYKAMADRVQQLEIKRQDERSKLREQISICFEDATVALKRSDIIKLIQGKLGLAQSHCYRFF